MRLTQALPGIVDLADMDGVAQSGEVSGGHEEALVALVGTRTQVEGPCVGWQVRPE